MEKIKDISLYPFRKLSSENILHGLVSIPANNPCFFAANNKLQNFFLFCVFFSVF